MNSEQVCRINVASGRSHQQDKTFKEKKHGRTHLQIGSSIKKIEKRH